MFTRKDLCRLIIPLVIEQILAVTIGVADTVMVTSVGEAAVSGISLVDTINLLLINIFSALATGGTVVCAQYLGRGDSENSCLAAKQLFLSITLLSTAIMVFSLAGRTPILRLIFGRIEPDVMESAQVYFLLSALSYPFLAVYNAGAALFRSMRNSKVSMFTSLLMNVVNISGNALLIFGFKLGVAGAGIASLLSRLLGAVIMVVLLKNQNSPIYIDSFRKISFQPAMVKGILKIGVPNGLENGMFQIGKLLVQGLIASFGTAALAANAVAGTVASMEVIPGQAIGLALITVVGQCAGAGDYGQVKKYTVKLMQITYLAMGALNAAVLLAIPGIVGFYSLSPETSKMAMELMYYHGLCCILIWPASFTLPNALRAANDAKFTMLVAILSMWTFRIAFSYVLGRYLGLGVLGVWIAMTADWLFRAILFVVRFWRGKWMNRQLI